MSLMMRAHKQRIRMQGYQGDPGLFSFVGNVIKGVVGGAAGFLTGGPVGAAAGFLGGSGLLGGSRTTVKGASIGSLGFQDPTRIGGGISTGTRICLPGSLPGIGGICATVGGQIGQPGFDPANPFTGGGTLTPQLPVGQQGMACTIPGYKLNKTGYYRKRTNQYVQPGTVCVKRRRMNPLNPRAASRAMTRLCAAKRAVTSLNRITIRKKKSCGSCK